MIMAKGPMSLPALMAAAYHVDGLDIMISERPISPAEWETLFREVVCVQGVGHKGMLWSRYDFNDVMSAIWSLADIGVKLQKSDTLENERTTRRAKREWLVSKINYTIVHIICPISSLYT